MTREEAIEYIKSRCIGSATERDGAQWSDAMWTAIEALQDLSKPNNTCEVDLISRQDAIDALMNDPDWADAIPTIKSIPSAEPKTGKWVKIIDEETPNLTKWHYECDQCGAGRWEEGQRYCQNCGARMIREDGEA